MTLEQAIDRYTNNAEYERRNGSLQGCMEFRQLAEWLKDYKRLLEQEPYICDTCKHKGDGWDTEPCDGCCGNHSGYEPCEDAISRQAVIKGIEELKKSPWATANRSHGYEYLITEALDVVKDLCVKQLPSVTQKSAKDYLDMADRKAKKIKDALTDNSQKYGKWILTIEDWNKWTCSKCGYVKRTDIHVNIGWKFCPNCGAKMQESEEKE